MSDPNRLLTRVELSVGLPTVEEITRIVDAFFDANPLSTAYGVFQGDDQRGDLPELTLREQRLFQETAVGYWWLNAARKRAERPE
jgi:hypothetical protein